MLKKNIDLVVGLILVLYFFIINSISILTFKYLFLIMGLTCFLYHFIKKYLNNKSLVYKFIKKLIAIIVTIFILVEGVMFFYPKQDLSTNCDYIIVLGALVNKNKVSKTLKDRLDTCVEYVKNTKENKKIIVSGAKGKGENITEASAMKKYLISKGIDEENIILEQEAKTTKQNFYFSKILIEKDSNKKIQDLKIKVVTTDFHTLRSKVISKKLGYNNTTFYTSSSKGALIVLNYTREFFALICNIVFDY